MADIPSNLDIFSRRKFSKFHKNPQSLLCFGQSYLLESIGALIGLNTTSSELVKMFSQLTDWAIDEFHPKPQREFGRWD